MKQTTPNGDLLQSQTSVNEQDKESCSDMLMYREQVENTPFHIVGMPEEGYFTALGKYMVTNKTETIAEQEKLIKDRDWMLILSAMRVVFDAETNENLNQNVGD